MAEKTKILVIDDEEVIRRIYAKALASEHCKVDAVAGGKDALQIMERRPFDVVLLDLMLPGMDGMTILKNIKKNWPDSEVITLAGNPALESAKQAIALGAYDYLAKPVGADEVIHAANAAVMHKRWVLRCDPVTQQATTQ